MALLKSFLVTKSLPDPNGPFSSTVKLQAVESANQRYLLSSHPIPAQRMMALGLHATLT